MFMHHMSPRAESVVLFAIFVSMVFAVGGAGAVLWKVLIS